MVFGDPSRCEELDGMVPRMHRRSIRAWSSRFIYGKRSEAMQASPRRTRRMISIHNYARRGLYPGNWGRKDAATIEAGE